MEQTDNRLYSRPVLDLITVGAEYCKNLERVREADKAGFLTVMRGLLPMIYLKVSLLGEIPEEAGWNLPRVTEEDYEYVRTGIADTLGEDDSFLDVFVEDFKFSEAPGVMYRQRVSRRCLPTTA